MSEHLNSEAIGRRIAGERNEAVEGHLFACAECRAAVARMESALGQFRSKVNAWSESQPQSRPPLNWVARAQQPVRRSWMPAARWVAVAVAALILAAVPIYRNVRARRAAAQAQADALLLEEVAADISRPAPEPLEPLVNLVSQTNTGDKQ